MRFVQDKYMMNPFWFIDSKFCKSWLQVIKKFLSGLIRWKWRRKRRTMFCVWVKKCLSDKTPNGNEYTGCWDGTIMLELRATEGSICQVSNILGLTLFSRCVGAGHAFLLCPLSWESIWDRSESDLSLWIGIIGFFLHPLYYELLTPRHYAF